jgi:protein-L-isoaspartate(D-aspartate) O-methyltransferase
VLGEGPFDATIVTVGSWDVAPPWRQQLADQGMLVLPLIMNGVTRTRGFRSVGDHLVSTSMEVAGFVPMRGIGQHPQRVFLLPDGHGHNVKLRFDQGAPADMSPLEGSPRSGTRGGVVGGDDPARGVVRRPAPVVRVVPAGVLPDGRG